MPQAKVTVFGSLNYDYVIMGPHLPAPGETVKGDRFLMQPGGKGANQALQAARLGARTTMIGCLGRDFMGDHQLELLAKEGVETAYIQRHETLKTGTALIFVENSGQNEIMIASNANGDCTKELIDRAQPAFEACDVFLTQLETNTDAVWYAIEKAHQNGCFIILDPAPIQSIPDEVWSMVDLIKPNENEAAYYSRLPVDEDNIVEWAKAASAAIKTMGVPEVLITLGAKGCYYSGKEDFYLPPYEIQAVDATAAGDSFAGALATALGEKMPMRDAVSFASAAGAVTASKAGAQISIGARQEVDALFSR